MVYRHPSSDPYARDNLYGFNHAPSVVTLPNGNLLAVWFSAPFEASVDQVILGSYSSDSGKSWSRATVLQDVPRKSDFDPAFISDGNKTLFFYSVGRHNIYPAVRNEKNAVGLQSFNTWLRISDDSGRTWSEPRLVGEHVFCRSNGVRLSTGELLLPIYGPPDVAGVLKSTDDGRTWKRFGSISTSAGADEPTLAELSSGTVLMVLRTRDGYFWTTRSQDKGETWSRPERSQIHSAATSSNLFRLKDGRLLLTLDESTARVRTPLVMRLSSNDGESWGSPVQLDAVTVPQPGDAVWGRQVTYPSVAQLSDGTVVVVWTDILISDDQQYGDIKAARVRVTSSR